MHALLYSVSPNPEASHLLTISPPETLGQSWASRGQSLVGSLLLSPRSWCTQGSVYAFPGSVSPVLCKFWWLYCGLMVTSFNRAYAIPKSTAPRAPAPTGAHCWPVLPQETPKHSPVTVSVESLGPGIKGGVKVCLGPLRVTGGYAVWF